MTEQQLIALRQGIGDKISVRGIPPQDCQFSARRIESKEELLGLFGRGNWSINVGFVWQDLAFVQQSDGGDEWLTLREREDGSWQSFESISFYHIIKRDGVESCSDYLDRLAGHDLEQVIDEPALG